MHLSFIEDKINMDNTSERAMKTIEVNLNCPTCGCICQNRVRRVRYYDEYFEYDCLSCDKKIVSKTKYPYVRYEPI